MPTHNHEPCIPTRGLVPGCPRCEQHAKHPYTLDATNLEIIWHNRGTEQYSGPLNDRVVVAIGMTIAIFNKVAIQRTTTEVPTWITDC